MSEVISYSLFTEFDIYLFQSGKHFKLYEKFGAHEMMIEGKRGVYFAVYAPAAKQVSVIGDFNEWNDQSHLLNVRWDSSGIWEGFVPGASFGHLYKFKLKSDHFPDGIEKADPYAFFNEKPSNTASIIWNLDYKWNDKQWMQNRKKAKPHQLPMAVYEMHVGSWRHVIDESDGKNRPLTYTELGTSLIAYLKEMNFTHVEFMPITEYPYDKSWGYQVTGFFAPTSRYGDPQELMFLIDQCHKNGIGVILDWVPAHFPSDAHGLALFDGSHVYEHPDRKKGYHPDWKSLIFNYERNEVRSFLISSAFFWLETYHIDGLRVDAVASMLYLDYSREEGEWDANQYGGNENLAAISFLKELNAAVYNEFPGIAMVAEESTAFGGVTRKTEDGGLGFGFKWMMGWMHDTLDYFKKDPIHRKYHQGDLTFSMIYMYTENFMLPLSHDEVVHGKGSIINRMPGDEWQRFANLRVLYSYMYMHPGSKINFMGNEIGQYREWNYATSLDWHLLDYEPHKGIQQCFKELNRLYSTEEALYLYNYDGRGFEWIDYKDFDHSVISFLRKGTSKEENLLVMVNFTPNPRDKYKVGIFESKEWKLVFNSDDQTYWGSHYKVATSLKVNDDYSHGYDQSVLVDVPPLSCIVYKFKK